MSSRARALRIAVVHSFYSGRVPSGENQAVQAQVRALRSAGHEVLLLGRHTDELEPIPGYALRAGLRVATGRGGDPTDRLAAFEPDVVHVHNLFPNIGTRWLGRWPGPLVATVHNFRALCANGLLFREGAHCTRCPDGDAWAGVRLGCYRGSRLATVPLALRSRHGVESDAVLVRADRVVLPSAWARDVYTDYGLDPGRVDLIANFVSEEHAGPVPGPDAPRWVCVGRLTPEKGVADLMGEWPPGVPLDVIGAGPDAGGHPPEVRLLGPLDHAEVRARLPGYTGLVLPGRAREVGVPLVAQEALEAGLPVVSREDSGVAGVVGSAGAGAAWGGQRTLASALQEVSEAGALMRSRARAEYERHYTAQRWLSDIAGCYDRAMR